MQFISINKLKTQGLQARVSIDEDHVNSLAEVLASGKTFYDNIQVYLDSNDNYWVADGLHRIRAYLKNNKERALCDVHPGSRIDALRHALGANSWHGKRRTREDIANAIKLAYENRKELGLPDVPSASLIAEIVQTNHHTVERQLGLNPSWLNAETRTGKDGKDRPVKRKQEEDDDQLGLNPSSNEPTSQPEPPVNDFVVETTPAVDDAEAMMEQTGLKPIKDLLGQLVTLHAREAFEHGQQIEHKCRAIAQAVNDLVALKTRKSPIQSIDYDGIKTKITTMLGNIRMGLPGVLCPRCKGEHSQCSHCDGKGWHSRLICKAGSSQFEDLFGFKYGEVK